MKIVFEASYPMLALVELSSGFRRQLSDKKSENSACLTPGFSPGKKQMPEPTGFSRKAGRSLTRGTFRPAGFY
jgi:hypothetical protein